MSGLLQIRLVVTDARVAGASDESPKTDADLAEVMSAICECLERRDVVLFEVSGFGQMKWPVDVCIDLAVVAEQIPSLLERLVHGREAELDFYEQGVQRLLTFERADNDSVRVLCRSGTSWEPAPGEHVIARHHLIEMLGTFGRAFADVAQAECPGSAAHREFQAWLARLGEASVGLQKDSLSKEGPNLLGQAAGRRSVRCSMSFVCLVCGFPGLDEDPRPVAGSGSFEICPSCGFQFGVSDDDEGFSYDDWRKQWVDDGMVWDKGRSSPAIGWDPVQQLARIGVRMPRWLGLETSYPVSSHFGRAQGST